MSVPCHEGRVGVMLCCKEIHLDVSVLVREACSCCLSQGHCHGHVPSSPREPRLVGVLCGLLEGQRPQCLVQCVRCHLHTQHGVSKRSCVSAEISPGWLPQTFDPFQHLSRYQCCCMKGTSLKSIAVSGFL